MARTVKDATLDSRTARARLKLRREPHWKAISKGAHIGYRKGKKGGTWIARYYTSDGTYAHRSLGVADDAQDANGNVVLSFAQAQERGREWFRERARQDDGMEIREGYTVAEAIDDYLAEYGKDGRDTTDIRYRINAFILPELGHLEVAKLSSRRLRQWRNKIASTPARVRTGRVAAQNYRPKPTDDEGRRKRRHTANKILTILKAALNFAYSDEMVASDDAWRRVKPFLDVDKPKIRFPSSNAEVIRLVNGCEGAFKTLVQGALLSGCRYGELAKMQVGDFDRKSGVLRVKSGKTRKTRDIALADEATGFFRFITAGRGAHDLIFARDDGKPWGPAHQRRPMLEACERARITPPISFHILRHWYAAELVRAGVPIALVAENLGHADPRRTANNYSHLSPDHRAEVIRKLTSHLGIAGEATVIDLDQATRG